VNVKNNSRTPNKPKVNVKVNVPKMEDFNLFLRGENVNNGAVKGLLNKIIRYQKRFNASQKPKIRAVLNKILQREKQPQNLNSVARKIKATMFPTNNRQSRRGPK
jgi:hypothetical protein